MRSGTLLHNCGSLVLLALFYPLLTTAQNRPGFDDLQGRAAAARERDDLPQAIELYAHAVRLKPDLPEGWWFLGSLQYQAESYAEAVDALNRYVALVPDAAPAWALRGLCEFETGDYSKSLSDIQRGLSLGAGKESIEAKILHYHEALLLTRSGNFDAALQEYRTFAPGKVPNAEFLVGLGLAGLRTPLLPRDLKADKQDLFLAAGQAVFRFMSGDQASAQQAFQTIFQQFPSAANAHYLYGWLLLPTDPDQADVEFKRELEIAPANPLAQVMVAWHFLMHNDFATALGYAQKALTEDPNLPPARIVLGRALVETGDIKHGTELLKEELQREPNNLEIHFALAKAYTKSGRREEARRERLLCFQIEQEATTDTRR
jgi:predicted Zn-dependent protease